MIETVESLPKWIMPYWICPSQEKHNQAILLEVGIIEPTSSPWSSPIVPD